MSENKIWERIGRGYTDDFSHWELFADEEIYKRILELRWMLEDHHWGARLTRGDSDLIFGVVKDLEAVANSLYLARQELVEAQEQEPPSDKILGDLLRCYHSTHYYTGYECSFCLAMMESKSELQNPKFHNDGCPLPGALKWLEEHGE